MKSLKTIPIVSIYTGVKSHGLRSGKLSIIIETYTPNIINPIVYPQPSCYTEMTLQEIYEHIQLLGKGCRDISIIGPEPLLTNNINILLEFLDSREYIVEVDTYGNANIADYRVERNSMIPALNKLKRDSNIRFILYYSAGNNMYIHQLDKLSTNDVFICRIRSEHDLSECVAIINRFEISNICFVPVSSLISPDIVMKRIVSERLWRVRYQPTLYDVINYTSQNI